MPIAGCRWLGIAAAAALLAALPHPAPAASGDDAPLWPQEIRRVAPGQQHYERVPARPVEGESEAEYTLRLEPGASVRVSDSTGFVHEGVSYRLTATMPLPGNEICVDGAGTRWACGLRGRAVLRALIVGKRLRCRQDRPAGAETAVTCLSGRTDIAARIVAEGLALAAEGDDAYAEPQARAQRDRKGFWAAAPTAGRRGGLPPDN